jgi:hypothetical protein
MKKLILLTTLLLSTTLMGHAQKVRYANYWLFPTINNVENLSKYDMAIVDKENIINNKNSLYLLKKKNPKTILLLYLNPIEIFSEKYLKRFGDKPFTTTIYNYLSSTNKWWLKNTNGDIAYFDPRQQMLNMSSSSKKFYVSYYKKEMHYWEFIAQMQLDVLLGDTIIDGIFEDNFETFEWLTEKSTEKDAYKRNSKQKFDIDGDGKIDNQEKFKKNWREGMKSRLKMILEQHPDFIIIGNKGKVFLKEYCNNKMFENWPDIYLSDIKTQAYSYNKNMQNLLQLDSLSIINVEDEKHFWLAFASIMLTDKTVFLSMNQNDKWNNSLYVDYRLWGKALGKNEKKFTANNYYREFKNGYFKITIDAKKYKKKHKINFEIVLKKTKDHKSLVIRETIEELVM